MAADSPAPDNPSHSRAREFSTAGDTVLDIGCGGGRAAFAVAPLAGTLLGVDHQQGMLDTFAAVGDRRGLRHREVLGDWPDVADGTPDADVVVCHHLACNVAALGEFAAALDARARRRVVLEFPDRHPLATMAPLWRHSGTSNAPTARPPARLSPGSGIREQGSGAHLQEWDEDPATRGLAPVPAQQQVEFMRIRLCLSPDRDGEIAALLSDQPDVPRRLATI